jgi:hypothetical protein
MTFQNSYFLCFVVLYSLNYPQKLLKIVYFPDPSIVDLSSKIDEVPYPFHTAM